MASASSYCIVGLITLVYVLGCTSSTVLLTPPAIDMQISYLSSTMCYNRSELLSYNDGTGKVSQDVWHRLLSLGINAKNPTHRGSKGTRSGLKLITMREYSQVKIIHLYYLIMTLV